MVNLDGDSFDNIRAHSIDSLIDRNRLQQIDAQVTDRLVMGKLSGLQEPIIIHGVQFLPANFNGGPDWLTITEAGNHRGEDTVPKRLDPNGKFQYMLDSHLYPNFFPGNNDGARRSQAPLELPYLDSLSLVYGADIKDPNVSRIGFTMPVQNKERDSVGRMWGSGRVLCTLPTATTKEFLELVRKQPAYAEFFLQTPFNGIDSIYQRSPVHQVLLWDVDQYLPQDVENFRNPQELFNKVYRKRINSGAVT